MSEARIIGRQDSIQNTFELRSIHTANFRKGFLNAKRGRRKAPTPLCPFLLIPNFCGVCLKISERKGRFSAVALRAMADKQVFPCLPAGRFAGKFSLFF